MLLIKCIQNVARCRLCADVDVNKVSARIRSIHTECLQLSNEPWSCDRVCWHLIPIQDSSFASWGGNINIPPDKTKISSGLKGFQEAINRHVYTLWICAASVTMTTIITASEQQAYRHSDKSCFPRKCSSGKILHETLQFMYCQSSHTQLSNISDF